MGGVLILDAAIVISRQQAGIYDEQRRAEQNRYASLSNWFEDVKGIIAAASKYKPEAIARQVLAMLK